MADATGVRQDSSRQQFPGVFENIWRVTATINADSLIDGAGDSDAVAVPGVRLGDMVIGISLNVDIAGITVSAYVSASNVVTVRFQNESGGTVDLASTTIKLVVARPAF
jgi:hypothetical protein